MIVRAALAGALLLGALGGAPGSTLGSTLGTAPGASLGDPSPFLVAAQATARAGTLPALPRRTTGGTQRVNRVLAISVDGLNPTALDRLGAAGTPAFHRLLDQGASTLNARTETEQTVTLPNHTSMLTGRPIDARHGGHGVTWDDDRTRPATAQAAAGHAVDSVFGVVHRAGRSTALFSAKTKFSLYRRSFGADIDRFVLDTDNDRLARTTAADLVAHDRAFTFLHLSLPDLAGHAHGWLSPAYLDAVRRTDAELQVLLDTIDRTPELRRHLAVVLTADHGGLPGQQDHSVRTSVEDYRIPFLVWGPGVRRGDLYRLDPDYRDPGTAQPPYSGAPPVRNGDLANLSLTLLRLPAVPGSELDADQDLNLTVTR